LGLLVVVGPLGASGCGKGVPLPNQGAPPPPRVTVAKPVAYPVQKYFEYNGYLEAVATNEIRARVKGFLDEVHFKEGVEVEKGAPLYTIDPRQYAAAVAKSKADIAKAVADMASATAQITLAQANLDRFRASGSGASKSETDQAQATLESNKAAYNVAAANKAAAEAALQTAELELSYTEIKAPIAGRIGRTLVTRGNLVGQTDATLLATIVSVDPIYAYFDTPEKDLAAYQQSNETGGGQAMPQAIPIELGIANEEGYPHRGTLDFRDNRVDIGTGTIKLRASVPNPVVQPRNIRLLYPGLYARIRVPNGPVKEQLTIPEEALMTGQEGRFVYVIGEGNKVLKRTVAVGANVWRAPERIDAAQPGWNLNNPNPPAAPPPGAPPGPPPPARLPARSIIAVEQGLDANDQVIVIGLQKARPGAPVTPDLWELVPPPKK
jgi:RND family efflux transporter MFP subunit